MATAYKEPAVEVKNVGASEIPRFGVCYPKLNPDGASEFGKQSFLNVTKPDTTYRREYLINGPQPIPVGAKGFCYWAQTSPVWAAVGSVSTTAASYGPKNDSYLLWPLLYGFRPYSTYASVFPSETSQDRVLVTQNFPHIINGKYDEPNTRLDVWSRDLSVDSGMYVSLDMSIFTGDTYADNLECLAAWVGDGWMLAVPGDCPL